jgi:hypothetical protein
MLPFLVKRKSSHIKQCANHKDNSNHHANYKNQIIDLASRANDIKQLYWCVKRPVDEGDREGGQICVATHGKKGKDVSNDGGVKGERIEKLPGGSPASPPPQLQPPQPKRDAASDQEPEKETE